MGVVDHSLASDQKAKMRLKVFCIACCLLLVSGYDADKALANGITKAIQNGLEGTVSASKSLLGSHLDTLNEALVENEVKSENKMKEFNAEELKEHLQNLLKEK